MKIARVAQTVLVEQRKPSVKTKEGQEIRDPSAFARHRRNVEESDVQIKVSLCLLQFSLVLLISKGGLLRQ